VSAEHATARAVAEVSPMTIPLSDARSAKTSSLFWEAFCSFRNRQEKHASI
jgi:hypothetical protein